MTTCRHDPNTYLYLGVTGHPAGILRKLSKFPREAWDEGGKARQFADGLRSLVRKTDPAQLEAVENALTIIEVSA